MVSMKNILLLALLSILLLTGCSFATVSEKRGFSYKTAFVEFTCGHEPAETTVKVDKEAVGLVSALLSKLENGNYNAQTFSQALNMLFQPTEDFSPKKLVTYCRQLLKGDPIQ